MKYQVEIKQCAKCRRCCYNSKGTKFDIQLTDVEQNILKKKKITMKPTSECPYLTQKGCRLKRKPFICRYYPFFLKNVSERVQLVYDSDCPISTELLKTPNFIPIYNNIQAEFIKLTKKEQKRILKQYAK